MDISKCVELLNSKEFAQAVARFAINLRDELYRPTDGKSNSPWAQPQVMKFVTDILPKAVQAVLDHSLAKKQKESK